MGSKIGEEGGEGNEDENENSNENGNENGNEKNENEKVENNVSESLDTLSSTSGLNLELKESLTITESSPVNSVMKRRGRKRKVQSFNSNYGSKIFF